MKHERHYRSTDGRTAKLSRFRVAPYLQILLGVVLLALTVGLLYHVVLPRLQKATDALTTLSKLSNYNPQRAEYNLDKIVDLQDKLKKTHDAELAARFDDFWLWVVAGTTVGMMLANVPVVFLGERITRLVPMHWVHRICAAIFIVLALTAAFWP